MADLPCPNCGTPLAFLDQYQRYYCVRCGQYAPEGYGDRGAKHCQTCGGILSYVSQYNRFYCYRCNTYSPEEVPPAAAPTPATETPTPAPQAVPTEAAPATAAPAVTTLAATELAIPPSTPAATLVATPTPATAAPAAPATPEASPTAESGPESKPSEGETPRTETSSADERPAEPAPHEPSPEIRKLAASKPGLVRVKIFTLKKADLLDLCQAYDLDATGTKEQVQERLLSYLHDLEAEEATPEEAEASEETAPRVVAAESAPADEELASHPAETSAASVGTPTAAAVAQLERSEPQPAAQPAAVSAAPVVVEVPHVAAKVEHPCPTCGRELTFISQYGRHYCYFCQRYAPALRAKGACPTCGATMRWIDQHQRWWCDACQRYAPADLPRPATAAVAAPRAASGTAIMAATRPAIIIHHHANPAAAMGLLGLGLALWIIVEFFAVLAPAMSLGIDNPFSAASADLVQFFAVLFVAGGALMGLSSLRDRI